MFRRRGPGVIRRDSLLFPVSCVTGWGLHPVFLHPAKEGDRLEKDPYVVVGGGSSCFCQRGCTGVALGEARQDSDGKRDRTAIEQVGTNIWLGGKFTQVKQRNGTVVANVSNLAVFDSKTNQYENINLPKLGGKDSEVWDMTLYGKNVLIAGASLGLAAPRRTWYVRARAKALDG